MIASDLLHKWRFAILLAIVLCTLIVEPLVFGPRASSVFFYSIYSLILLSAVYAVADKKRGGYLWSLGAITLLTTWLPHVVPDSMAWSSYLLHHLVATGFLLLIAAATLKGLFRSQEINLDIVLGSLAGYLLLGTAWGFVFSSLHLINPDSFLFHTEIREFVNDPNSRLSVFIYYSFVTLTTLGFGDMSPASQAARTLSWLEAVVGQFYIATLVAGIVGIFVTLRSNDSDSGSKLVKRRFAATRSSEDQRRNTNN